MTRKFKKNKLINFLFHKRKELIIFIMRTFIFLFCATLLGLTPKHVCSQNEKIVIDSDKLLSVDAVFKMIKSQTNYSFVYHEDLFKDIPRVKLKKGVIRLNTLLSQSLSVGTIKVIFTSNNIIFIKEQISNATAQHIVVTGKVTDQTGLAVPGVTVLIKGTAHGTATDIDGYYTIRVPDPAHVLVFSSLGFDTKEIAVGNHLPAGQAGTTINVVLKESISVLEEVTINAGYYKTTERERTGNIIKIDAKTIEKQPVTNPLAAMAGYISGVNITQNTGVPGGGFKIEIRGKNFINGGTEPLYIVDGVPYNSTESFKDPTARSVHSDHTGGLLNLINPSNIESIEVLKDGDATSIYGSRGANGVVLITTKKGKAGKTKIVVKVSTRLASVPRLVDLLNTQQYLEMRKEAIANDGYTLETLPDDERNKSHDLFSWDQNRYTDWQEVLIGGTAYSNTANLSFSGGNQQTQFLISGAYQNETTVFIGNSKYGQASVHGSINHQSDDDRLQVNLTMDYTASDSQLPSTLSLLTIEAYNLPPNAPALYHANGDLNWENSTWVNPLAQLEAKYRSQAKNLILNTILSYRPIASLELKANLGYTDYRNESYNTIPTTANDPALGKTSAQSVLNTNNAVTQSWIVEPQINWKKEWSHASFNMLMGATFSKRVSKQSWRQGKGFPSDDDILNLQAADLIFVLPEAESQYNYQSFFGRLNFKWADRYIINLTGRRDGSSRFGPGKQFGNFGALGAAWLFSKESFLEENRWLTFGKLRSSYGITGSDNIGDYEFFDSFTVTDREYNGPGLDPTRLFNPNFAWESNNKFEVALELGFMQDRLQLTTAWYRNRSSNQLIGIPLPGTTGFASINSNFDATVENTGLEIDFRVINIQNEHFKWATTFNISMPKNKLVKFDGLEDSTFRNTYVVGEPLSIKKRYHNIGVDPETGIYQFEDYNNDGVIDIADLQLIEHTAPKFYGGIGNTINYKNWTLDAFFQFKKQRANSLLIQRLSGISNSNQQVAVLDRWQQVGGLDPVQRYTVGLGVGGKAALDAFDHNLFSDKFFTDASFVKLRNVSLSYDLASGVIPGMDVSIYLQGHNLLTFTKFKNSDPESAIGQRLPPLRQFSLGVQLGF